MKICVLGGTGSISREIVEEAVRRGHEVTVFNRGARQVELPAGVRRIIGDRSDYEAFESKMKGEHFDAVIDMIAYRPEDGESTLRAFDGRAEHFVFTSSIACYKRPFHASPPIGEEQISYVDDPANVYGYQKGRLETMLRERFSSMPITIARPSLTFGRGGNNVGIFRQNYGLVKRMREGRRVVLFGDGQTPMNFTFTPDIARGYLAILDNERSRGQIYHLISDQYSTWEDLYRAIGSAAGAEPAIVHIATDLLVAAAPTLNGHLYLDKQWMNLYDSRKARTDLGWRSELTLESGFRWLVDWYDSGHDRHVKEEVERFEDDLIARYDRWKEQITGLLP